MEPETAEPSSERDDAHHAALWFVGPDMPGLLRLGAKWVQEHGGNIEKDIAVKFGEMSVVFMSVTADPLGIAEMYDDRENLKNATGCGVVFEPMEKPTIPDDFEQTLFGLDVVTDDASGLLAGLAELLSTYGIMIVGHTGERRVVPGPKPFVQSGQKLAVLLPHEFDCADFREKLDEFVKRYRGDVVSPLRPVPGLLWWW
ncbi:MAG: hypothetical protein JSU63_07470 [Phycisphaerales bacterium]|nr:MAG: hypothetical protein JSU63_07470 [Phycisphaerales bacterium]